jgi:two-component system sensor histidine kinase KdpD
MQYALAALATAAATVCSFWLDTRMSVAGLALVYLIAVAATAALLSRAAGVATCLMSAAALNYFFVPPRYTFEIDGAEYWWTLAVLLGVSLALNALIASLRTRQAQAQLGEARAAQLHELGDLLAQCESADAMAEQAATWLSARLGLACAVFLRSQGAATLSCHASTGAAAFQPSAIEWAIDHGRPLGRGCDDWPDLPLWCAPFSRHDATGGVQFLLGRNDRPDAGEREHWLAMVRQVGLSIEREQAAHAARAARDQAQAEATRNTLLASLSHDLRTPLAAIIGSASALRSQAESLTPSQRDHLLANLENEARDMTLMADNILQMARLSQPHRQLALQWESVEELLGSAVERMRRRWPRARIQWRVAPGLPPVNVEAGLIAQVIANLVDNALRHAGEETDVVIQAGRSRTGIFIAVRDHGPGLSDDARARLFERFERGGDARPHGAGLGLAICKTIIEAHGGRIDAQSETHSRSPGAEFRIDLPARTDTDD